MCKSGAKTCRSEASFHRELYRAPLQGGNKSDFGGEKRYVLIAPFGSPPEAHSNQENNLRGVKLSKKKHETQNFASHDIRRSGHAVDLESPKRDSSCLWPKHRKLLDYAAMYGFSDLTPNLKEHGHQASRVQQRAMPIPTE
eukprot:5864309-Amphidinium_carterae.3